MRLLNNDLDKVLYRMRESLIFAKLNEVSIIFEKESFINAKIVLNFIQSLTNKKKVIKFLTAYHARESKKWLVWVKHMTLRTFVMIL